MIQVENREVQHPIRFQLVPVAGTTDQYDLVPVPGVVTKEGTPLNNVLFEAIQTDIAEDIVGVHDEIIGVANNIPTQAEAEAGTDDTKFMTPLKVKQATNKLVADYTLSSAASSVTISNLDINADGGEYEITFQGAATTGTNYFGMTVNNLADSSFYNSVEGPSDFTASYKISSGNSAKFYFTNKNSDATRMLVKIKMFLKDNKVYIIGHYMKGTGTSTYCYPFFCISTTSISNITSIKFTIDTTTFKAGTTVKVFKKG